MGVLTGSWGVGQWLLLALGWIPGTSGFYHSSVQSLVYMNCFITGFFTTALPRFSGSRHAAKGEVAGFFFLIIGILLFLTLEEWVIAEVLFAVWLMALMRFALVRVWRRPQNTGIGKPPQELVWVPFGVLNGVLGAAILALGQMDVLPRWALKVGKPMMEQGFLLSVVVGVGGFLVPRLLGTYRPVSSSMRTYAACALLVFVSFWLEGFGYLNIAYGLRAAAVAYVYSSTGILKYARGCDLHARLAWVAAWMVAIGYGGAALFSDHAVMMLHITFIGGFSLMTFAVASMVILSHSGHGERLKRPLWVLWLIGSGVAAAVIQRMLAEFFPERYIQILGAGAALWIISAFVWLIYMVPFLLRVPDEDAFGRMHEQVKDLREST